MYRGDLVSGFVNISIYFNKLANNFKPLDRFFKRIKILLVIQTEISHSFVFRPTLFFEWRWFWKVMRKFILINSPLDSPFQLAQCSTVPNNNKKINM